jgi:hypothetical protein
MGVITIDASQVTNALKAIEQSATVTPQILAATLDAAVRQRMVILKANTPYSARVDPRYPVHLRDSYHYRVLGKDAREIYISPISSAWKFIYVTEGTSPHTILPNAKQAVYGLGLEHPYAYVRHPGTRPNPFHEQSEQQYTSSGMDDKINTVMANGIVNMLADTINAANMGGTSGGGGVGMGGLLSSMLGLVALLGTLTAMGGAVIA